jgi:hypothetical protein
MKLVLSKKETAAALGKSVRRFDELRPRLEAMGFPRPVPGLGAAWSVLLLMQWVNRGGNQGGSGSTHASSHHQFSTMDPAVSSPAGLQGTGEAAGAAFPVSTATDLPEGVVSIQRHLEARYGGRT